MDIGCGPGSITVDLASRFPLATFTSIDPGELFVSKAEGLAKERGVSNVEFRVGNVYDLVNSAQKSWDVVHAHQVLSHLSKRVEAVKIIKSLAKSPGIVALRDALMSGLHFYPALEGIKDYLDTVSAVLTANGADPDIGMKLLTVMLEAGFKREQIKSTAGVWSYVEQDKKSMWVRSLTGIIEDKDAEWHQRA